MKTPLEKIINKSKWLYVNDNLNATNFPIPDKIETEGWKLIKMSKSFSSQEALDEIKRQGCRPANVYELALWMNKHREKEMSKGTTWCGVIAFGSEMLFDGYRRVPYGRVGSDGAFRFRLDGWEGDWLDNYFLLAFCDKTLSTLDTQTSSESDTLTLESRVKELEAWRERMAQWIGDADNTLT